MKGIEKLVKTIGFGSFALLIASFFGTMLATWIPGDPAFWTTALLWLSIVTMVSAPGMLIAFSDVGRVKQALNRHNEKLFPEPPEFDPEDFEGDNVFGTEHENVEARNPIDSKELEI